MQDSDDGLGEGGALREFLSGLADAPEVPAFVQAANPYTVPISAAETELMVKLREKFAAEGRKAGGFEGVRPGWGVLRGRGGGSGGAGRGRGMHPGAGGGGGPRGGANWRRGQGKGSAQAGDAGTAGCSAWHGVGAVAGNLEVE
jgi:hypothetical protein